jgi:hypothetical protein
VENAPFPRLKRTALSTTRSARPSPSRSPAAVKDPLNVWTTVVSDPFARFM